MQSAPPNRAQPPGRAAHDRWMIRGGLLALSLCALLSEGCASLGIGGNKCGSMFGRCGSRLGSCNLTQKLFHRRTPAVATDACEPGLGAVPMESGGMMMPSGPLSPPALEGEPNIQPNDPSLKAPGGTGAKSGAVKSLYQAQMSGPRGEASTARREEPKTAISARDPLSDIPGLSPTNSAAPTVESSPPVAPTAGDRPAPDKPSDLSSKPAEVTAGLGPGIRRFRVVETRLAVGSLPTETGWKWLSEELGYKTVIDLRQPSEVVQSEIDAISHHGLRYIAIPMSKDTIDPAALARLEAELAREELRPVYVFDADGLRPAAAGFLHLATVGKIDVKSAERKVEELGAADSPLWRSAQAHLVKIQAASSTTLSPAPDLPETGAGR